MQSLKKIHAWAQMKVSLSFFILQNWKLLFLSDTKKNLFGNYFLKCNIVKSILISFNCFSEYI